MFSFALGFPQSTLVAFFLGDRSCGLIHVLSQGIRMARQISGYEIQRNLRVRIENMSVHESNRAGLYPAGIRCRDLCVEVLKLGFLKEEFTHGLVAVEENRCLNSASTAIA